MKATAIAINQNTQKAMYFFGKKSLLKYLYKHPSESSVEVNMNSDTKSSVNVLIKLLIVFIKTLYTVSSIKLSFINLLYSYLYNNSN